MGITPTTYSLTKTTCSAGQTAVALINASLEYLKDTVVMIRARGTVSEKSGSGYNAFAVPSVPPWQMVLLIN
jgi:hypothetical protein